MFKGQNESTCSDSRLRFSKCGLWSSIKATPRSLLETESLDTTPPEPTEPKSAFEQDPRVIRVDMLRSPGLSTDFL